MGTSSELHYKQNFQTHKYWIEDRDRKIKIYKLYHVRGNNPTL